MAYCSAILNMSEAITRLIWQKWRPTLKRRSGGQFANRASFRLKAVRKANGGQTRRKFSIAIDLFNIKRPEINPAAFYLQFQAVLQKRIKHIFIRGGNHRAGKKHAIHSGLRASGVHRGLNSRYLAAQRNKSLASDAHTHAYFN